MLKISKLADYALLLSRELALSDGKQSASMLAQKSGIPSATIEKLLKIMHQSGLVQSYRGSNGGYMLSKSAVDISAKDIIESIDGPIRIADCSEHGKGCERDGRCPLKKPLRDVEAAIQIALGGLSLQDLSETESSALIELIGTSKESEGRKGKKSSGGECHGK